MSHSSPNEPQTDAPLSPAEEHLLEVALGRRPAAPTESAEGAALRELVAELRRVESARTASEPHPARVAAVLGAVADRVAGQRRSSWSLLKSGLRHSALLRVAAASLLIHLAALPVLAWLHYANQPSRALYIEFEKDLPMPVSDELPEVLQPMELAPLDFEDVLQAPAEPSDD